MPKSSKPKAKAASKPKSTTVPAPAPKKVATVIVEPSPRSAAKPKKELEPTELEPTELEPTELESTELEETPQDAESLPVVYDPYDPALLETVEKSSSLAARDPLKKYLQELKNAPTLTVEQEALLAKRMHEAGDVNAAKLLVSANLKLVVKIAYEYRSMYHNLLDLVQEGNVGLMKAVSKFDPTKGARLGYYASWWIRSYILKYLLDNFRLVRVGTSAAQKKLFYHLMREKQRLEAQGIKAGPALLAANLDVKEKDVIEMEQRLLSPGAETSLDAPGPGEDGRNLLMGTLTDSRENADLALERDEWLKILADEIPKFRKSLNDKERALLDARILSEEPQTLQEVADQFGLTRERARQIEAKLIVKLREQLKKHLE